MVSVLATIQRLGYLARQTMTMLTIIFLGVFVFAYARKQPPGKARPSRFPHLKGWQKVFGVLGLIMAFFVILNPDFLALGLLGDAAFFDMLVLMFTLQMSGLAAWMGHGLVAVFRGGMRRLGIPSPGLHYLMGLFPFFIADAATSIKAAVHRILS